MIIRWLARASAIFFVSVFISMPALALEPVYSDFFGKAIQAMTSGLFY